MTQANPTAKDMFESSLREAFFGTVKTSSVGDTNLVPEDSATNPLITTNTGIVEG